MKKNFTRMGLLLPLLQKLLFAYFFLVLAGMPSTFAQSTVSTVVDLGGFGSSDDLCTTAGSSGSGDVDGMYAPINLNNILVLPPGGPSPSFNDPVPANSKITNIEAIIWNTSCPNPLTVNIDVTSGAAGSGIDLGIINPDFCGTIPGSVVCPNSNSRGSVSVDLDCGNPGSYVFGGSNNLSANNVGGGFIFTTHIELIFTYEPLTAAPVAIVTAESTCSTIGGTPTGGAIAAPSTGCPAGFTLMYSTDGTTFSATLPTYDPLNAVTVTTRCDCGRGTMSPTASVTTVPGVCPTCPDLTAAAPIAIVSAESTCSTIGGTPAGGTIAAPSTSCPAGSTLMYSIDGTTFTTTLPIYDPTTAVTVTTRCDCDRAMSPTASITTVPGVCPTCPDLTAVAPTAIVTAESTCSTIGGTPTGGIITAPSTSCPTGSTLMYSIDGATFTTTLPIYDPTTAVTVTTRCDCDGGTDMSPIASVITMPGACPTAAPLQVEDLSVTDPCSCDNPNNIVNTTGLRLVRLFHDVLEVTTTAGVTVTLSATDNNLLDASGNPMPVGTLIPETSPGVYQLTFYTLPAQAATITVSNGASTEEFTTASCTQCEATIPTMSQWGLMIFGLLILNMSLVFVGRLEIG